MNKEEFVAALAAKLDKPKTEVAAFIKAHHDVMIESLKGLLEGETIQFIGFGSYKKTAKKATQGRNPRTGETIAIPASKGVKFTLGKDLKDALNSDSKKK